MSAEVLRRAAAQIREDCPIPEHGRALDFIDYPTGWALQRVGLDHVDTRCSAAQSGGALLCDCGALYPAWRRWRALLVLADWIDDHAGDLERAGRLPSCDSPGDVERALQVALAYLPDSPVPPGAGSVGSTA